MFFDSWQGVLRVITVGIAGYTALLFLLRISGKRTLTKLNAFDQVVTIALGSTFATVLLSNSVALVEGVTAFALLIGLQFVMAWSAARSERVARLIKSQPALVFYRGEFLTEALRRERLTEGELMATLRNNGISSPDEVEAVVLETSGDISILQRGAESFSTLRGVSGMSSIAEAS